MSFYNTPRLRLHDTTHSPVGLWQFQGNALDSSGNSLTLTWAGTEMYTVIGSPIRGAQFDGGNHLSRVATAALQITGDMTIAFLSSHDGLAGVTTATRAKGMVTSGGPTDSEADNILYRLWVLNSGIAGIQIHSEHGAGINDIFSNITGPPPFAAWHHSAYVRTSDVWTVYLNGALVATSPSFTTPTGGGDGLFRVGADQAGANTMRGAISSLKIIASALTASQVLAEARLCGFA